MNDFKTTRGGFPLLYLLLLRATNEQSGAQTKTKSRKFNGIWPNFPIACCARTPCPRSRKGLRENGFSVTRTLREWTSRRHRHDNETRIFNVCHFGVYQNNDSSSRLKTGYVFIICFLSIIVLRLHNWGINGKSTGIKIG